MEQTGDLRLQSRILYKDENCVVINKLAGEAAQSAAKLPASNKAKNNEAPGIVNLPKELKKLFNTKIAQAVHRIDVPVTGCVLFALNSNALKFLNDAFAGKSDIPIDKRYWAIIEKPSFNLPESGCLTHWIEVNSRVNKSFAYNEDSQLTQRAQLTQRSPGRKKAVLNYKIKGEGDHYLFMEILLVTGRHHQIRCQLAALDLHIKGDVKYGARRNEKYGGIRLHARSLSFPKLREASPEVSLSESEIINIITKPPVMDNLWKAFPCN